MKKIILLLFTTIVLCGCEKTENLICTNVDISSSNAHETNVNIVIKDNIVETATYVTTLDDTESAQNLCTLFQSADENDNVLCDGQTITIKNFHQSISKNDLSRSDIVNYFEKQGYTCQSK